jgi:hypothetical protein
MSPHLHCGLRVLEYNVFILDLERLLTERIAL